MFMHLQNPYEETIVLTGSDSTLLVTPPNSTYGSTLVSGFETLVISLLTQQHSSVESVKHREYSYEMIKLNGAATVFLKPLYEFPELFALVGKLVEKKPLDETDEANLRELAGATGWSVDDVVDDLRNGWGDPLGRVDRYREMFETYYREALELVDKDSQQAAEKLWGAVTALVKLHASLKRVFFAWWDHGKLYNYVTHNVEEEYRELFYGLLMTGRELHRYFYEGDLDRDTFINFWNKAVELLEEAREVVYRLYAKAYKRSERV
jgi:hypothetical protein